MYLLIENSILLFIIVSLVAGNNLSATSGAIIGSRTVSRFGGALIGFAGYSLGYLIEGARMTEAARNLLPPDPYYVTALFFITAVIFVVAELLRSPLSLTMALVGASIGISLKHGFSLNYPFIYLLVATWILAPLLGIGISYVANRQISRKNWNYQWRTARVFKVLMIFVSVFTGFTLGANTMGLIGGFYGTGAVGTAIMIGGIGFGSFFLGRGTLRRVGQDMFSLKYSNALVSSTVSASLVQAATVLGVPLSNTQTLTSSVFGCGLSYKTRAIFVRPFLVVVLIWMVSPISGMLMGYLI